MSETNGHTLGDVASFIRGITFTPDDVTLPFEKGTAVCMRTKNVQADLDEDDLIAVPKSFVRRTEQYLTEGDMLVSSANSWNLVGKCSWVPKLDYEATAGGFISILRADRKQVDPRYLYHWFSAPRTQHDVRLCGRQTTNISNLNYERCLNLPIPLPKLEEQKRIAAILDKADAIRQQQARALRDSLSLGMAIFLDMFGDVSINDKEWHSITVADAGDVQLGRQRAPKYQSGKHTRPYIRVANVYEDRIDLDNVLSMDFDPSDYEKYRLGEGDILLNEGQSTELVGRPAIWRNELADCCFQNTLVRFRAYREKTDPEYALGVFLRYLHASKFASVSSKTSSVAHLGAARFARMPFPLPPLDLQKEFSRQRTVQRRLANNIQVRLAELDDLFKSLVQRAFKGEM